MSGHERDHTRRSPNRHMGGSSHGHGFGATNMRNFHGNSEIALFVAAGTVLVRSLWQFGAVLLRAYLERRARKQGSPGNSR